MVTINALWQPHGMLLPSYLEEYSGDEEAARLKLAQLKFVRYVDLLLNPDTFQPRNLIFKKTGDAAPAPTEPERRL